MGKSSWKRRVKESATQNRVSEGDAGGGWSYIFDYKNKGYDLDFVVNGGVFGDKPLQCIGDADEPCRCIAIEGKSKGMINPGFFCAFSKNSRGKTQALFQNSRLKTQGLAQKLNVPEVI